MKCRKILLLIVTLFLFSGCTIDYNIKFKRNHNVDEKMIITEKNSNLKNPDYTIDEIIQSKFDSYKTELSTNSFSKKVKKQSDLTQIILESKNKRLERFQKFIYFQKMFNKPIIEETEKYFSFDTAGYYDQSGLFYDETGVVDDGFVDKININITFEDKVISSNADKVNEKTNTYTWVLDKTTTKKRIKFKLENKKSKKNKILKGSLSSNIIKSVLIIFGIGLLIGLIIWFKSMDDNNKI